MITGRFFASQRPPFPRKKRPVIRDDRLRGKTEVILHGLGRFIALWCCFRRCSDRYISRDGYVHVRSNSLSHLVWIVRWRITAVASIFEIDSFFSSLKPVRNQKNWQERIHWNHRTVIRYSVPAHMPFKKWLGLCVTSQTVVRMLLHDLIEP